jgi:formylglycine-generating enzyme required for sulfatase activity
LGKNVRGYEEYRNVKDGTILIQIPAGVFTMGYEEPRKAKVDTLIYKGKIMQIKKQGGLNVKHKVDLNTFFIGKYEITNAQYKLFCDQTEHSYPPDPKFKGMAQYFVNYPNYPVVNISWEETKTYCDWAGMRLPTEAEWEKSARGTSERKYPWGNENPDVGNQYDKCNYKTLDQTGSSTTKAFKKEKDKYIYTSPVDSFSRGASPYGVFNMAGNVNEWCADWLNVDYYSQSPERNPTGPDSGQARVVRGGCWDDISISHLKTTERGSCKPDTRKYILGFRTAK